MKVIHLGSSDLDKINIGGVSTAVLGYASAQAQLGHDISIMSTSELAPISGINTKSFGYSKHLGSKLQFSYKLYHALKQETNVDIIHNHGLWRLPNIYPGFIRPKNFKTVCSPHGVFSPWAMNYSSQSKQFMLRFMGQQRMLDDVDLFHATCEEELIQIRNQGLSQPVMIVENGVDIPPLDIYPKANKRTMIFLGRIHPIKGLDFLLQSWLKVAAHHPDWELKIAGPIDHVDYKNKLNQFIFDNHIENVTFVGSVSGKQKEQLLAESDYLVLTSHSENFGMVVAEALAHALPVLVTDGVPWPQLESKGCGWWVPREVETFDKILSHVLDLPRDVSIQMGRLGRSWAMQEFSWEFVAKKLVLGYEWVIKGVDKPNFIKTDK